MCDIESKQERKEKNRIEKKRKKKKENVKQNKIKQNKGFVNQIFFFLSAIVKSYQVQRTSIVKECCFKAKKRKALQQQQ